MQKTDSFNTDVADNTPEDAYRKIQGAKNILVNDTQLEFIPE